MSEYITQFDLCAVVVSLVTLAFFMMRHDCSEKKHIFFLLFIMSGLIAAVFDYTSLLMRNDPDLFVLETYTMVGQFLTSIRSLKVSYFSASVIELCHIATLSEPKCSIVLIVNWLTSAISGARKITFLPFLMVSSINLK